jgi:hypothetical protein
MNLEHHGEGFEMTLVLIGLAVWLGACALVCGVMMVATSGTAPIPDAPARRLTLVHGTSTGAVRRMPVAVGTPERDAA